MENIAIVVSSCDAFSDLWTPFFTLFFRYWPACPFPIYLIANEKHFDNPRVTTINCTPDKKWASNLRYALGHIDAEHILYFQEDYLLRSRVDENAARRLIAYAKETNVGYLRLCAGPAPDEKIEENDEVGVIRVGAPYRASLQLAIWKKNVLERALVDGENGWEMENFGSRRTDSFPEKFLSVWPGYEPIDYFSTAVKRNMWLYDAVKLCDREGIAVDRMARPTETRRAYIVRRARSLPYVGWIVCAIDNQRGKTMTFRSILSLVRKKYDAASFRAMPDVPFWYTLSNGLMMKLDKTNYGDFLFFQETSNVDLLMYVRKNIRPGMTVLDIGAQKGYVTLSLAHAVGESGHVISFEPDPRSYEILRKNIERNNLRQRDVYDVALSDRDGTAQFTLSKTLGWSSLYPNEAAAKNIASVVNVTLQSLDGMVSSGKIALSHVEFVKIDCEGAELTVLRGMRELIKKFHPILWIEINKGSLEASHTNLSDIYGFLQEHGYTIRLPILTRNVLLQKKLTFQEVKDFTTFSGDCYDIVACMP